MPHQRNLPPKPKPTFYAIIDAAILQDRKLGLPAEFVRKFGNDLCDVVVLKVPTGKLWAVELIKVNGGMFLNNGWHEFMEYYSLSPWQLLVFTYDESCRFDVRILDNRSRCEIDYGLNADNFEESNHLRGFSIPPKKANVTLNEHKPARKDGAIQAANALRLLHPFFTVIMRASYVQSGHPPIPQSFVKKYFTKKVGSVILTVADGRTWEVGCSNDKRDYYILRKGWRAFQTKMELKVGNVCVFELIRSNHILLKVHVLRDV